MKRVINWFKDMIDAEQSVSSKRFCGVVGFIAVIFVMLWCTLHVTEAPKIVETVLYIIAGLLGIDKLSDLIRRKK